jgi:hypothetical protein
MCCLILSLFPLLEDCNGLSCSHMECDDTIDRLSVYRGYIESERERGRPLYAAYHLNSYFERRTITKDHYWETLKYERDGQLDDDFFDFSLSEETISLQWQMQQNIDNDTRNGIHNLFPGNCVSEAIDTRDLCLLYWIVTIVGGRSSLEIEESDEQVLSFSGISLTSMKRINRWTALKDVILLQWHSRLFSKLHEKMWNVRWRVTTKLGH